MKYFFDNKDVDIDDLKKSGKYPSILIEKIQNREYNILLEVLSDVERNDINFMEPILYAVKRDHGTYQVYKYYGENVQNDIKLAKDIIKEEPELIDDMPVSFNREFILEAAEINPRVIQYMSEDLKADSNFTKDLCNLENLEITKYVAKECKMPDTVIENPNLKGNKVFMIEAVKEDAKILEYASDELKNNYEFIKEVSNNTEAIDYIVDNTDQFGKEGLSGAKDALIEISSDEAISGFEQEKEEIKNKILEVQEEKNDELEELLKRDKQLERHIKFFERIKNGDVDPVRAAKLIDKICVNMDERYKNEIKKVLKLDEVIQKKDKDKLKDDEKIEKNEEDKFEIIPENIENITNGASLEGIREETVVIRENIKQEKETLINKVGEKENGKTNDERA